MDHCTLLFIASSTNLAFLTCNNYYWSVSFQVALVVQNPAANAGDMRCGFDPWVGKIPWRRVWELTPVFLLGESPWTEQPGGLQSMGSPWGARSRRNWSNLAATAAVSAGRWFSISLLSSTWINGILLSGRIIYFTSFPYSIYGIWIFYLCYGL